MPERAPRPDEAGADRTRTRAGHGPQGAARPPRPPAPQARQLRHAAPGISIVVLTLNEERNVEACLQSLARQTDLDFEVILVDAASSDRTLAIVDRVRRRFPVSLRVVARKDRLPIGEARNLGVSLAKAPLVGFLSADAEVDPDWVEEARRTMREADLAFGLQVHAPAAWTVGAAVRGLRYHFPAAPAKTAEAAMPYASNVAALYRREVLLAHPFEPAANAAEDLLLARRASRDGHRLAYNPRMVTHHHDVASWRQEMRKNTREGDGCGRAAEELGVQAGLLAWGLALAALAVLGLAGMAVAWALLPLALWAPALRRAWRRRDAMPPRGLALGVVASPAFDLAFLATYVRGLAAASFRPRRGAAADATAGPARAAASAASPAETARTILPAGEVASEVHA